MDPMGKMGQVFKMCRMVKMGLSGGNGSNGQKWVEWAEWVECSRNGCTTTNMSNNPNLNQIRTDPNYDLQTQYQIAHDNSECLETGLLFPQNDCKYYDPNKVNQIKLKIPNPLRAVPV